MNARLLRPLATGFDPRRIAGLAYWLDASDSTTITTVSGAVSEWRSKVSGTTATQSSAANRPAYTLAGRNGRNVVTFDGTSSFMTTGTLSINQPLTIFWAGSVTGTAATYAPYIFDGTLSGNRVAVGWNSDGATKNGRIWAFSGSSNVIEPASGQQAYGPWSVVAGVFNGASSLVRSNGSQVASGTLGGNNVDALTLGSRFNQAAGSFINGPWGAFLIYNRALSADEMQRVERYLGRVFSVTIP